jgi:hypothetical protein
LDIWSDMPIRPSRRARLQVGEAPSPDEGFADREDHAPDREEDAPSQVHRSHI